MMLRIYSYVFLIFCGVFLAPFLSARAATSTIATTTVTITICGDAIVTPPEVCDSGANNGIYSTSTANRHCNATCTGYAPYCGDGILQVQYGEQCDQAGSNGSANSYCSATCQSLPVQSGGGGGGGGSGIPGGSFTPTPETRVTIQGLAYPNSDVHILKDGQEIAIVRASPLADFYFTTNQITAGVTTFGFWAQDSGGLKSIALTTSLTVVSNAVTTISGEFLPPTISLDKLAVKPGDILTISGHAPPVVTVETHVNSANEITVSTSTDVAGAWSIPFDTAPLAVEDFHTAKALFKLPAGGNTAASNYSQSVAFYVGQKKIGKGVLADLNHDGRVNLVDFSIMLFYWNTSGPIGDLNGDHKVNLTDFSILLYYWTG